MTTSTLPPVLVGAVEPTPPVVVAPPRYNFAGFCNWCGQRGCTNPVCVCRQLNSWWAICPDCRGSNSDYEGGLCHCLFGVVEVAAGYPGAVNGQ